jgi:hypothetical protein
MRLLVIGATAALTTAGAHAMELSGRVTEIRDGDTFDLGVRRSASAGSTPRSTNESGYFASANALNDIVEGRPA